MSFDPYEILGVPRDVDARGLKVAFKGRSKATHPDVNGTGDDTDFIRVKKAYDILTNEEERSFFDATGLLRSVSEQNFRAQMFNTLKVSFDDTITQCFDQGIRITDFAILEFMRKKIESGLANLAESIDTMKHQIDQLTEMRSAIKRSDDEENLFSIRIGEMIEERESKLLEHVNGHKVVEMTLAEVNKYTSTTEMMMAMERERAEAEAVRQASPWAWGTSTSSSWSSWR